LNFQQQKSFKNQYLPHSEYKSYQINSIKSCSSWSSNNTKGIFQFVWNFQLQFNLIFSEEIIQYSRTFAPQVQTSWNKAHARLLVESFPKTPRTRSETSRFSGSHNDKTKQTTFLHRWILSRYPMAIMGKELKKEEERCFEKWNSSWSNHAILQDSLPFPEDKWTKIILQALYVKAKRENCPTELVVVLGPGDIQPESYVKD